MRCPVSPNHYLERLRQMPGPASRCWTLTINTWTHPVLEGQSAEETLCLQWNQIFPSCGLPCPLHGLSNVGPRSQALTGVCH